ncbi:F-box/kelch-repeat protein At3g23880-like [Silene latifolia]|uniref:F-box/kelch-repeat protein At3g23880-like n=1 Tax=Silene latifolia TaxID=37657 RepID=UPI003D77598D
MHLLPQDIKFEILARLPVKLLLSLKSVNKEWYALISDPDFAKLHLQYQNTTRNPNSMLQLYISSENKLATLEFQRGNVDIIYKEWLSPGGIHLETTVKMWDSELDVESYPIAGSSNGLICYISGTQQKHLCLCNPATRQQRLIAGPINDTSYIALRWGFGYDSSSDDYKTVLVGKFGSETQKVVAHVFSLQTNCWRELDLNNLPPCQEDIGNDNNKKTPPVQVGNTLNWLVDPKGRVPSILAFDLTSERFNIVPPPPPPKSLSTGASAEKPTYYFLSEFKQCLCVCLYYEGDSAFSIKGWMLQDQAGDQQTWKTFLNLRGLTRYFSGADRVYPKLFELKDGSNKVLIFETSVWSVLAADPRGEIYLPPRQVFLNFRRRASFPDYLPDYLLSYTESLVSLSLWKEWTTVKKDAPLKLESNCKKARYR